MKMVFSLPDLVTDTGPGRLDAVPLKWSSDGKYIAWADYSVSAERSDPAALYLADVETAETLVISANVPQGMRDNNIIWSDSGKFVAFCEKSATERSDYVIRVYEVLEERSVILGEISNPSCTEIAWAPDSQWLAVAEVYGDIRIYDTVDWQERFTVSVQDAMPGDLNFLCNLAWSPDDMRLLFSIGCIKSQIPVERAEWYGVYIANLADGSLVEITQLMDPEHSGAVWADMQPHWAPDGSSVVVTYTYALSIDNQQNDLSTQQGIILYSLDSEQPYRQDLEWDLMGEGISDLAWSSQNIVVWSTDRGWVIGHVEDMELRLEIDLELPIGCGPRWSADGRWFAFTQNEESATCGAPGQHAVYVFNPATGELINMTSELGGENLFLGWSSGVPTSR